MSNSRSQNTAWKLIQPELLSISELVDILKERKLELQESDLTSKVRLMELFKRVAEPLPQRSRFSKTAVSPNLAPHISKNINHQSFNHTAKESPGSKAVHLNKSSPTKTSIQLKRPSSELAKQSESTMQSEDTPPKKREKITWP